MAIVSSFQHQAPAPVTKPQPKLTVPKVPFLNKVPVTDALAAAPFDATGTVDGSFSLDSLLSESLQEAAATHQAKVARATIANGAIAKADSEALTALVRQWETRREWLPKAAVVMWSRQRCQCCGRDSVQFLGWYQRQSHRSNGSDRWVQSFRPTDAKLPRESKYQDAFAETCELCAEAEGFEIEGDWEDEVDEGACDG